MADEARKAGEGRTPQLTLGLRDRVSRPLGALVRRVQALVLRLTPLGRLLAAAGGELARAVAPAGVAVDEFAARLLGLAQAGSRATRALHLLRRGVRLTEALLGPLLVDAGGEVRPKAPTPVPGWPLPRPTEPGGQQLRRAPAPATPGFPLPAGRPTAAVSPPLRLLDQQCLVALRLLTKSTRQVTAALLRSPRLAARRDVAPAGAGTGTQALRRSLEQAVEALVGVASRREQPASHPVPTRADVVPAAPPTQGLAAAPGAPSGSPAVSMATTAAAALSAQLRRLLAETSGQVERLWGRTAAVLPVLGAAVRKAARLATETLAQATVGWERLHAQVLRSVGALEQWFAVLQASTPRLPALPPVAGLAGGGGGATSAAVPAVLAGLRHVRAQLAGQATPRAAQVPAATPGPVVQRPPLVREAPARVTQNVTITVNGGGEAREIALQVRRELQRCSEELRFGYAARGGD